MAETISYEYIITEIRKKVYRPIYYLSGPESYYIDRISDLLEQTVLTEDEKDFNLNIIYGKDSTFEKVVELAMAYPVMAEHRLVIVREAQSLGGNISALSNYLSRFLASTILVFCHKNESLDKRKKICAEISKCGILFESAKLKEAALPGFISDYLKGKQIYIDKDAASVAAEYIGSDLNKLTKEMDKLVLSLPPDRKNITLDDVVTNIDSLREYNVFELKNALVTKNVEAAFKIIRYIESNPKANPLPKILPLLFNFYSNLMLAYYAPEKTPRGIAAFIGLKSEWQAKEYINAMRLYTGKKVMAIIQEIKNSDAKFKGVGTRNTNEADILKELVWFILH